jgi:hypothetical protein
MAEFTLSFRPGGREVEQNNYHTLDAYEGQVERRDVYDSGSKLNLQMSLVEIVHGTIDSSKDSLLATLIIADFQFISHDESRRFRHADIEVRFRDIEPRDSNPPEVLAIAPNRTYTLNKTEKVQQLTRAAKVNAGAAFVANVSTGLEWNMSTTETKYSVAKVVGARQMIDRTTEPKNAAVWSLSENKNDENGIPSLMRTSILLRRKNNAKFRCGIIVVAKVGWMKSITLESKTTGGDINPVLFDPMRPRETPVPPYIDPKNLGSVKLTNLMAIQSTTSITPAPAVQVDTVTDGEIPGLRKETVMRTTTQVSKAAVPEYKTVGKSIKGEADDVAPVISSSDVESLGPASLPKSESAAGDGVSGMPNSVTTTENGAQPVEKPIQPAPDPAEILGFIPRGVKFEETSSLEETMKLLLHAVRKGVEVMAEAVSMLNRSDKCY